MNSVNSKVAVTIGLFAMSLAGCAAQLEQEATAKLEADCASKGMQFVKTTSETSENPIVSRAQVAGECLGPTDSRYVSSVPPR